METAVKNRKYIVAGGIKGFLYLVMCFKAGKREENMKTAGKSDKIKSNNRKRGEFVSRYVSVSREMKGKKDEEERKN